MTIQNLSADGSGLTANAWQPYRYVLGASGSIARLEFDDVTPRDGFGGLIDAVLLLAIDYDSTCQMVDEVAARKLADTLCDDLRAARRAGERGQAWKKANELERFRRHLKQRIGAAVSAADAALLVEMVDTL